MKNIVRRRRLTESDLRRIVNRSVRLALNEANVYNEDMDTDNLTIDELLASKRTFYTKRLQENGYYPIDKFVWDEENGTYDRVPFKHRNPYPYGNLDEIKYILENNPFLISVEEFMNNKTWGSEGLPLVSKK